MTTSLPAATRAVALPRFAALPVGAVAAVTAVAHLVLAAFDGRWFDEALMPAIGRHHLDFGSADQPPVTPLLAAFADSVAPGSQLVMRLPAVAATAGAVLLAAVIAREWGGDARAQTLTALAQATALWAAVSGHWLTPYTLETVQWAAICWLLVRWVRLAPPGGRDRGSGEDRSRSAGRPGLVPPYDRLLLWLGVVVGVAAETQLRVAALVGVLAVAVAACGPRELLRRPALAGGALIAAVLTAPTVVWQALHGWPQLRMSAVVAAEAEFLYGGRPGVAVQSLLVAGVLGLGLGGYGLVRLLRAPDLRFLGVTAVALYVLVVAAPGRIYYLVGLLPVLAAAGAIGLQRRRDAGHRRWRWVGWPAAVLSVAGAAAGLWLSVQLSDPTLPRAIATSTAQAYHGLPDDTGGRTAIIGQSYLYATFVDSYSDELGLPTAYSTNRSYGYFDPPPETDDAALFVGTDPGPLGSYFRDAQEVGAVPSGGAVGLTGEPVETTRIWWLTGPTVPWARIWDEQRSLSVS